MPELPEVESIVDCLINNIIGLKILNISVPRPKILKNCTQELLSHHLNGHFWEKIYRRGKYIVMLFENQCHLITHLRMSGAYCLFTPSSPPAYQRILFELEGDKQLAYTDKRALGHVWLYPPHIAPDILTNLGPEPLDKQFTLNLLVKLLTHNRRQIKPLLLDQTIIAGIGNIYASEILYHAKINPAIPASGLTRNQISRLYQAIQQILTQAIEHKGTHISDFVDPEGNKGGFVNFLKVYQKTGESCLRCGEPIKRIIQQQRSTYSCPNCQQ